jgi:hypothetical protein
LNGLHFSLLTLHVELFKSTVGGEEIGESGYGRRTDKARRLEGERKAKTTSYRQRRMQHRNMEHR